jgi:hypothetical protein
MRSIVDPETQADPTLKSERLYTRLSAAQVRRQLIKQSSFRMTFFLDYSKIKMR